MSRPTRTRTVPVRRATVDGAAAPRVKLYGWATGFETDAAGRGELRYDTSILRYGLVLVQVLFWIVAVRQFVRTRRRTPLLPPLSPAERVLEEVRT